MDKAQESPKFKSQMQGAYASLDNLKSYADYVNPFTVISRRPVFYGQSRGMPRTSNAPTNRSNASRDFAPDNHTSTGPGSGGRL